ncbi:MAG: outer membrane lipoprotein-sorting protein, partial [Ignavibacterium album]|uniref:outer membrane lipoprotein-sorting protein n=1 Tax=Ignavibacterium album TaxID=591197 RepID=UPI0026EA0E25
AKSSYVEMTMTIIKPNWQRKLGMKVWALEPDYAMIFITEPAKDKGTVTLKRKNEIWNYLPTVQKIIKIPPSMMNQSWMGSDFTNDDLVRSSSYTDDYTHKLLGEEKFSGYDCYKIESIPKPNAGVVWSKVISFISKNSYMQLKSEFYDEDGRLTKIFIGSEIKNMSGKTIPTKWEMIPLDKDGNKTVLEYQKIEWNISISENFFSQQNMTRVK